MTPAVGYSQMKDSGIEWVGMIPADWDVRVLFQLISQVKCKNSNLQEQNLLSLSYGKIKRKNINQTDGLLPASFDGYNIIQDGDIVLRLTDLQNDHTSLRVGRATERGIITSAYTTIRPLNPIMSKYIYYVLHTFDIKKGFYGMGSGVRQGLNFDEIKMLKVPMPPTETQISIAAFLDTQCAKIDELIDEAKASIEEYKAWKASVIYEAVTKGLDPDVEMKDSGIEWVGMIPCEWDIIANKYVMHKEKRICESWGGEDVLSLTTNGVIVRDLVNPTGKMPTTFDGYQYAKRGELLMCLFDIDVTPRCVGRIFNDGVTSPAYSTFVLHDNSDLGYYYYYYLMVDNSKELLHLAKNLRHSFTEEQLGQLKVPHPPLGVQRAIANYLDTQCAKIDELIAEKQTLVTDLESYKKSLIYEVVTGKRKVI